MGLLPLLCAWDWLERDMAKYCPRALTAWTCCKDLVQKYGRYWSERLGLKSYREQMETVPGWAGNLAFLPALCRESKELTDKLSCNVPPVFASRVRSANTGNVCVARAIHPNQLHSRVEEELWCRATNAWDNVLSVGEWEECADLDGSAYAIFIIASRHKLIACSAPRTVYYFPLLGQQLLQVLCRTADLRGGG